MRKIFTTLLALTAMASASAYDVTVTLHKRAGDKIDNYEPGEVLGTMKNDLTYDESTKQWTITNFLGFNKATLVFHFDDNVTIQVGDGPIRHSVIGDFPIDGSIIVNNGAHTKFEYDLDPDEIYWDDEYNDVFKADEAFVSSDGLSYRLFAPYSWGLSGTNPVDLGENFKKRSYAVQTDNSWTVYFEGSSDLGYYIGSNGMESFSYSALPFFAVVRLSADGEEGPEIPDEPIIPPYDEQDAVNQHFLSLLEGQMDGMYTVSKEFESDEEVDLANVDAKIEEIWGQWKLMNEVFVAKGQEETLRSSNMEWGPWMEYTIPQELEGYYNDYDPDKYAGPNAKMQYRWGYIGDNVAEKYPLFIFMHGSGEVTNEIKTTSNVIEQCTEAPGLYFMPRIPNGITTPTFSVYRWYQQAKQWVWEKVFRQALLRDDIDHDKMYFMGISEGAYGSQMLASFYADYLGGAGPMAGGGPIKESPCENLRNTYFNLITGTLDTDAGRNELTALIKEYLDALEIEDNDGGYQHDVNMPVGMTHGSTNYFYTGPELLKHSRGVNPSKVRWENFPLDGRYRTGFYNLHEVESPVSVAPSRAGDVSDDRSYYEMDIDKASNTVNLHAYVVKYKDKAGSDYGTGRPLVSERSATAATTGKVRVYLNNDLVDLSKPVIVKCNGKEVYNDTPKATVANMVNSCAEFYDPARVYPASVEVAIPSESVGDENGDPSSIDIIAAGEEAAAPAEYFTLQGVRVDNPTAPGIYICRRGNTCEKILVK